jgi:rhodanese-related sulfurtransferase
MRRSFLQMAALVAVGSLVGLTYNALAPNGLPLRGGTAARLAQEGARMMSLQEVRYYLQQPGTVIVDARSSEEFELGHIPRALNVPADNFAPYYAKVAPELQKAKLIIVYCSGGSCGTSEELAKELIAKGYSDNRVAVFHDGLPGWMRANLPIERGTYKP